MPWLRDMSERLGNNDVRTEAAIHSPKHFFRQSWRLECDVVKIQRGGDLSCCSLVYHIRFGVIAWLFYLYIDE